LFSLAHNLIIAKYLNNIKYILIIFNNYFHATKNPLFQRDIKVGVAKGRIREREA